MNKLLLITATLLLSILVGCNKKGKNDDADDLARLEYADPLVEVQVMELKEVPFMRQLATNGRLRAKNKSVLSFRTSGMISDIYVVNGDKVKEGALLAAIDPRDARNSLVTAQQSYEKAEIDLNDAIIGFGFTSDDIPESTLNLAKIRSGFKSAQLSLANAEEALEACSLRSPFSGKVANVKGNQYEMASGEFCTIIDDSKLIVEFSVLENELPFLTVGNLVKVSSFFEPGNYINGRIITVNPLIDSNGQVAVEAEINNNGKMLDGMNVKVFVEKELPAKLVVPKSAVVLRDNHEVLFRYVDGKAHWTYVHILMDNSSEYVITANTERGAELSVGDMIIYSGNMNLADGTSVEVKE